MQKNISIFILVIMFSEIVLTHGTHCRNSSDNLPKGLNAARRFDRHGQLVEPRYNDVTEACTKIKI